MREPWFNRHVGVSVALILLGLIIFGVAAYSALTETLLFRYDHPITDYMRQLNNRTPRLVKDIGFVIDRFGNFGTDAIGIFLLGLFIYRRNWRKASLVFFGLPVAGLAWLAVVFLVGRPRPEVVHMLGLSIQLPSFPSGHTWTVLSFYAILLYLFLPKIHSSVRRWTLIVLYVVFILAIGFLRVYRLEHFFTDVIGGYGAGLAWAVLVIVFVEAFFREDLRESAPKAPRFSQG